MAEKKYYWLKLGPDFFQDKAIKKLRKIAGGDTYTIIYQKMLLLAIQQGNRLYFEGVEDTFAAELALELDEDEENVAVTCSFLEKKGLMKVMSEEEFLLTQCEELVGSETDAARRKRKQRNLERLSGMKQEALPEKKAGKETQIQIFLRLVDDYAISDPVREKMQVWFKYKTERKENYKEQGMKSLLKRVETNAAKHGDQAVCDLIDECMSSNYAGIIWDKLARQLPRGGIQNRVSEVDNW
ncbi:MAG: phage replisome organizer N-terminal domain-containing protein [Eubacteriales bacterium]|nr:phage replisome organizer N-terminal domain-containing protein [Eubacteriales bacterium]